MEIRGNVSWHGSNCFFSMHNVTFSAFRKFKLACILCLPTVSHSPARLPPHTSILFSCNSSRDFERHRACQFLIVTSQTEPIHFRAWLSNTKFWFAAYPLQIVNAPSLPQFLLLPLSLYPTCTHIHIHVHQVLIFFLSLSVSIPCTHKTDTHAYTIGSHALALLAVSPSVSDFLTHHLTEWLVRWLIPACMKCCHLPPLPRHAARQSIRQAGVCLEHP